MRTHGHHGAGRGADGPGGRLRAGAARRARGRRHRCGALRAARLVERDRAAHRGAAARLGATTVEAWVGPHVCGRCYEVPEPSCRTRSRRRPRAGRDLVGHALARPRRRGARAARALRMSPCTTCAGAPASPPTSTPTGATASGAGRLAGLVRLRGGSTDEPPRGDRGRARQRSASASQRACADAGRDDRDVRLVVVTKTFPASDLRLLAELGVTDVGENRHQEAEAKAAECADLDVTWHFVGGLQSNKAAAVATYADVVESVDRRKLVGPLARGAHERRQPVDVLLQVTSRPARTRRRAPGPTPPTSTSWRAPSTRGRDLPPAARLDGRRPLGRGPGRRLRPARRDPPDFLDPPPDATWLSAGMSEDLEHAIRAGATHVRIGSAVLGSRPAVQ